MLFRHVIRPIPPQEASVDTVSMLALVLLLLALVRDEGEPADDDEEELPQLPNAD